MKKSELNSSMIFKLRCGALCVLLDNFINKDKSFYDKECISEGFNSGIMPLLNIEENLAHTFDEDYNIIAIKQHDSCSSALCDVLTDNEPEEWDWIRDEEEDVESKVENTIQNITINITIDSKMDINDFVKELTSKMKNMKNMKNMANY